MGQARLQRQRGDRAAVVGDAPVVIDRPEAAQPLPRLVDRRSGRRIEERQAPRIGFAPQQRAQQQARQIGFEDLGRVVRGQRRCRCFLPQPDRDAGRLPRGAARALGHRRAARALGHEPGEAGAAVVARPPREAAVDDDAHVLERDAGFGDARREHELALARRRRRERCALRCRVDPAVQLVQLDVGGKRAERLGGPLDLGDAGKEGEQRALMLAERGADR